MPLICSSVRYGEPPSVKCYDAGREVVTEMREAKRRTTDTKLEQAFALCKSKGALCVADKCTGDACSVRNANCGMEKPKVANFHTHPYDSYPGFVPTSPSFGDLVATSDEAYHGRSEGVQCIASNQSNKVHCWQLKKMPDSTQMRALIDLYPKGKHNLGKAGWNSVVGNYDEYWGEGPAAEIELGGRQPPLEPPRGLWLAHDYREKLRSIKGINLTLNDVNAAKRKLIAPYRWDAQAASAGMRKELKRVKGQIAEAEKPVYDRTKVDSLSVGQRTVTVHRRIEELKSHARALNQTKSRDQKEMYDTAPPGHSVFDVVSQERRRRSKPRTVRRQRRTAHELGNFTLESLRGIRLVIR